MNTVSTTYNALKNSELKSTTNAKVRNFWESELKRMGVAYTGGEPGVVAPIEMVGSDHFIETFQKYAVDPDGGTLEGYEVYTLGELSASKEAENDLVQFEIVTSKVEGFLTDAKLGLLVKRELIMPIELLDMEHGFIIGGGRHRTTGLLTLYKGIEGWEGIKVAVKMRTIRSIDDAASYIMASNGSRSMTTTERAQITNIRRGISVERDPIELLQQLNKFETLTDFKSIAMLYFVSRASESEVLSGYTNDTLGKLGSAVINNVAKLLKAIDTSAPKEVLNFTHNGEKVVSMITKYSFDVLEGTWNDLLESVKEPIKDRKTGDVKLDANGEVMYSIEVARNTVHIAKDVAEAVYAQLEGSLKSIFSQAEALVAEAKAKKEGAKAAYQARAKVNQTQSVKEYMQAMGITLTSEQEQLMEAAAAEAREIAAQVEVHTPEVAPAVPERSSLEDSLKLLLS